MRKRLLGVLVAILIMVALFALSSCEPELQTLEVPEVELIGDTVYWGANDYASGFEIWIDGNVLYVENYITSQKLYDGQMFMIRAVGDGQFYLNSDWSRTVTYQAPTKKYTVTWKYEDITLEIDRNVETGTMPEYNGEVPEKDEDETYTYEFSGWTPDVSKVTEDVTYEAVFTPKLKTHVVTWMHGDDTLEIDYEVGHGEMPEYNGETPTKEATAEYTYEFSGWTPDVSEPVVRDVIYVAQFVEVKNTYTVTFKGYGGVIVSQQNIVYGESAEAPELARVNGYNFIGWDENFDEIYQDVTITALYEIVQNQICIDYEKGIDGSVTATFSINGDVNASAIEMHIELVGGNYSSYIISYIHQDNVATDASIDEDGLFHYTLASGSDITENTVLFNIRFKPDAEATDIKFIVSGFVSDETFANITDIIVIGTEYNP